MSRQAVPPFRRREFIKQVGGVAAASWNASGRPTSPGKIAIIVDTRDPINSHAPILWAARELQQELLRRDAKALIVSSPGHVEDAKRYIVLGRERSIRKPEAVTLEANRVNGRPAILVSGSDVRGLVYGVLDVADRVRYSPDIATTLEMGSPSRETPANPVRSVARAFCSAIEDKTWYYDKAFWRGYLTALATSRFNRFNLTFGIGYDFPRGVTGDYFHFLYPYLFDVPGYQVRVTPLSNSERDRNFEMLRFIAAETAARGLQFQVGIWTHAYQWTDSPHADHHVEGLTPENHAAYCRDALALLLKSCPEIQGLTLRVHGESGIPEGSYDFWRTVFAGIKGANRAVEIDMHAKGVDATMIDIAVNTGMPIKLSPKFWAEHMGLAYHQADIRELEVPRPERMEKGVFNLSNGSRRFLRYGYGDLFAEGRKYDILFRLWPGTQRTLLWGDPALAAGYGRTAHFCGASGLDICEPLFFKGREGSGLEGGRCAYRDETLSPANDWEKYAYTYRVWGRLLYNPEADAHSWRRYLTAEFGPAAKAAESALSQGSRILPILTTAHLPSAANHSFWPEIYTNMSVVLGSEPAPYPDTPSPKRFGTVSPLDPELFSSIEEYVDGMLRGEESRKYSPLEVAWWLGECAQKAGDALRQACTLTPSSTKPTFRRMQEDVEIEAGLGRFFSSKLRAGVLFEVFLKTGHRAAGEQALTAYREARDAWSAMAERAKRVYRDDVTYGAPRYRRGHWTDRLPAIDQDLAAMQAAIEQPPASAAHQDADVAAVMRSVKEQPKRFRAACEHAMPRSFTPGEPLPLSLLLPKSGSDPEFAGARLHYRHVNHAERWQSMGMDKSGESSYQAVIPGEYSRSKFALQYYFEISARMGQACLYPGLNADLANQPYFVVMQTSS